MANQEVWVTARFEVKNGAAEEMKKHLHPLITAVRKEKGCLFDDCLQSADDPNVFMFVEHWATQADFQAHVDGAAAAKWAADSGHLVAVPVDIAHFKSIW